MAESNLKKMWYVFLDDTAKRKKVTITGGNGLMSFPGTFKCTLKKGIKKCNSDRGKKTKNREWIANKAKKISCLEWKGSIFIRNKKGCVYMRKLDDINSFISDLPRTPTKKYFKASTGRLVNGKEVIGIELGVRPSNKEVPFNLWFLKEDIPNEVIICANPECLGCSKSQECMPTNIEQQQQQQVMIQQPEAGQMSTIIQQGYPAQQLSPQNSYDQEQNMIYYQQGYPAQQLPPQNSYDQEQNMIYYHQGYPAQQQVMIQQPEVGQMSTIYQQWYPAQQLSPQNSYIQEQNMNYYQLYQQYIPANAYLCYTIYPPVY